MSVWTSEIFVCSSHLNVHIIFKSFWTSISLSIHLGFRSCCECLFLPVESCLGGGLRRCQCSCPGRCRVRPWAPPGHWFQDLLSCVFVWRESKGVDGWKFCSIAMYSFKYMKSSNTIRENMIENLKDHITFTSFTALLRFQFQIKWFCLSFLVLLFSYCVFL